MILCLGAEEVVDKNDLLQLMHWLKKMLKLKSGHPHDELQLGGDDGRMIEKLKHILLVTFNVLKQIQMIISALHFINFVMWFHVASYGLSSKLHIMSEYKLWHIKLYKPLCLCFVQIRFVWIICPIVEVKILHSQDMAAMVGMDWIYGSQKDHMIWRIFKTWMLCAASSTWKWLWHLTGHLMVLCLAR